MDTNQLIRDELMMNAVNKEATRMAEEQPKKITADDISRAIEILKKYKAGKIHLEQKIVANEEFWKLRQWRYSNSTDDFRPATAWLWNCIQGRYSDAMDSYPTCTFLPREESDKAEAKKLSSIVPVILEQNRYEETYSDVIWYLLKHGGCCQAILWDASKHNGLGDISVKKADLINLFWKPGITNIQDSPHLFHCELWDNDAIMQMYPETENHLGGKAINVTKYLYDDNVDTSNQSIVVDWYYHKYVGKKKVLHYVKFVNDVVLYATENETQVPTKEVLDEQTGIILTVPSGKSMAERGLYDHGNYPFVTQALYPIEGSICGYGLTDIGRDCQIQIDLINKAITENAVAGAKPRFFVNNDGTVNKEQYADMDETFINVEGNLEDKIRPIDHAPLDAIYVKVLQNKIEELKQVTSNQDVQNGVSSNGVTAASAIAALQESAGKNARSSNKTMYRAYREVVYQVVELIRQFYDMPRVFRIMNENAVEEFVTYSNEGLVDQQQTGMGLRKPEFDIEVNSEKANPYKKMEQNELALNFYQQGFFNPQMTDQALACLDMMDFNHKEDVMQKIQMNGTLQQKVLEWQQMALQFANQINPQLGEQIANQILTESGQPLPMGGEEINLDGSTEESSVTANARNQARTSTEVE